MIFFSKILFPAILVTSFLLSYYGVEIFRRWSIKRKILDIPNERSSHQIPTPRGGGIVVAIISLTAFSFYNFYSSDEFIWSYLFGAILVVLISAIDDIYSISVIWRFLCHILASIIVIYQKGFWEKLYIPIIGDINLGILGILVSIFWIAWLINAYNFMDGIDGIAGIQAITTSIGWSLLGWLYGIELFYFYGLVIFFSTFGFLIHNWQPAKIFMGDVGSAFLGYTFAVFPFFISNADANAKILKYLPIISILFVWLFVFDSVLTIFKRILKREKIWQAHRTHIYQRLVSERYSHSTVALLYGLLSVLLIIGVIFGLILYKFEIFLISLVIIVSIGLILSIEGKKLLTKII